jgi:fimbrial isopeptide formation D2 family protein/LPXTG-motif cell wall-anchored protein
MWSTSKGECMKKIIDAIKRAPKRAAGLAIVAAAVLVPAALFAWGPDRPTFTVQNPADYVTFNSITNNPQWGDERNFVEIKEATAPNSSYGEQVTLQPGKEYAVTVFYHNNAKSSLNDAAHDYKGIAKNAFMRVQMPASVKAGEKARITGFVGASNANPAQVWDEAYGLAQGNYALRYVPDSAKIYSNGAVNGKTLPNNLYTTGTPLGYSALDGKLPGCNEFAGYVTFKFRVDQPNFEISKQVGKPGENKYAETITALPNEEVEYKIKYKNTGTSLQKDVVIKDKLPAGLEYVKGSTYYSNSNTGNKWTLASDNVTARGINLGDYNPGAAVYVKFKAKVVDNSKLEKCGVNTLVNTATAETNNGSKSDTATVTVSKTCVEKPNECKPGIPVGDDRCKEKPEVPETPKELPKTGAGDGLVALVGAASLIAAISYYVASRRSL